MRFILFDKIVSLKKGVSGIGIKNVTIGEEFFIKHYDRSPVMPEPLLIEAIAQVGGWVIAVSCDYKYSAVMGKISSSKFHRSVRPGDQLSVEVEIVSLSDYGSTVSGVAKVDGEIVAEVEKLMYVHHETSDALKKESIDSYVFNSGGFLNRDGSIAKADK